MNGFKKLVLTSAILAASSSAMALEAMDDASLSAATGQDGLTIGITSVNVSGMDVTWVDRDGFTGYLTDGGVKITNLGVSLTNLNVLIDAGSDATNGAQLNIAFDTTDDVTVSLAGTTIAVGDASAVDTTSTAMTGSTDIVTFGPAASITVVGGISGISGSIKLGNRSGTEHFMHLENTTAFDVSLTGGVNILASAGVGIGVGTVTVNGVLLNTDIDVVAGGLQIDNTNTTIGQVSLETVKLGTLATAASIGDVYLDGMNISSVMTVRGH